MSDEECRSPIGLDCCSCCLDLASGCDTMQNRAGHGHLGSPTVSHFRQLRDQLVFQNLNTDKLNNIMRQDSLESVVRDPCFLLNEGICNSNDQTMLSILLYFHRFHISCKDVIQSEGEPSLRCLVNSLYLLNRVRNVQESAASLSTFTWLEKWFRGLYDTVRLMTRNETSLIFVCFCVSGYMFMTRVF
ncbi:TSC22 domain family protein 3 isoform X2 [Osmerus mordax]|uniref:TSC22 domain family protein 3 isoform X2 n=1 Tax=Osmerus mordax TaxID=8014 RepID=UPI00350F2B83